MNRIEIVAETISDYIAYEQWLFTLVAPTKLTACIFCKETSESFFYMTESVEGGWLFVTAEF